MRGAGVSTLTRISDHEELWQPAWGVRTGVYQCHPFSCLTVTLRLAIVGLQGMFPLKGTAAVGVGALEYPVAERKRLAAAYVLLPFHSFTVPSDTLHCQLSRLGLSQVQLPKP